MTQNIKEETKLTTERGLEIIPCQHGKCLGVFLREDYSFQHHIMETEESQRNGCLDPKDLCHQETRGDVDPLEGPDAGYTRLLWPPHKCGDTQRLEEV